MEKSISQKVLEKIKQEKISPKSRWNFLLCRSAVIALLIFFLFAGAFSLGIIFSIFSQFEVGRIVGRPHGMGILFLSLPFIWIILLIFFAILAIVEFAKTRHGYKYKTTYVGGIFILAIIIFGAILYKLNFSDNMENYMNKNFSTYSQIVRTPEKVWSQPEEGLISGEIIENKKEKEKIYLRDWDGEIWEVDYFQALVRPKVKKEIGEKVKIIGKKEDEYKFRAQEIRPWNGRQMHREK
ncbi:MAG: hypothetical protein COX29_00800 [Candidatus Moranbacteria bacterium CG23_combo_of_CG06-09_8_20_14_all_35_22]|nr:MAG: hypothetical protein COX29_00800 [Candidatus Moranbacteria bacterium CG23_combo_of_CG06-09_8_20_14_all_35_22]